VRAKIKLGRAQQQLQHCLMQLHLEQVLVSRLLPSSVAPVPPQKGFQERCGSEAGGSNNYHLSWEQRQALMLVDRHLARCRLAHMFVSKGSWNNQLCVVEIVEDRL
jgi:hypothetical protein